MTNGLFAISLLLVADTLFLFYVLLLARRAMKSRLRIADLREALRLSLREEEQERQARAYLSHLLQMDERALPPLRRWAASADFLIILAEKILNDRPVTAIEFGSGVSTLVTLRCMQLSGVGNLISYEHIGEFADTTMARARRLGLDPDIRTVPLVESPEYQGRWYDAGALPDRIDLIIVDGPPANLHPETRSGAGSAFSRLSPAGTILLDDARRPGERKIVETWRSRFPDLDFSFIETLKGTVIGRRR